jgi:hypothetical protein
LAITDSSPVTMTAACELGTHRCKGVVLSLTDAHLTDCACPCHEPAPVDPEQELEDLLDREADAHLWDWSL